MPVYHSTIFVAEEALEVSAASYLRELYRHPSYTLNSMAIATNSSGHGAICAIGDNGSIVFGVAGRTPTARTAASSFTLPFDDVCTNNVGNWVCVGDSGQIQSSADGNSWTTQKSGGNRLSAVAHGAGIYTTVGVGGAMFTCPNANGATWTSRTGNFGSVDLASLLYVPELSLWFCTSRDGRIQANTNPTVNSWTTVYTVVPGSSPSFLWRSIAYSAAFGGVLALYRRNGNEVGFAVSANGTSWTTTGSVDLGWPANDDIRFGILDRQIVVFNASTANNNDLFAYVLQSPDLSLTSSKKFLGALGKVSVRCVRSVAGQLFICGQINGSPGTILMSHTYRPNTFSEI